MKCLSVKQPYAGLIASGEKIFEIRSWKTKYRGDVVICSSSRPAISSIKDGNGVSMCIVTIVDVVPFGKNHALGSCIKHLSGMFAWVMENPRKVPNIAVKGRLGFYHPPEDLAYILKASGHS